MVRSHHVIIDVSSLYLLNIFMLFSKYLFI